MRDDAEESNGRGTTMDNIRLNRKGKCMSDSKEIVMGVRQLWLYKTMILPKYRNPSGFESSKLQILGVTVDS